MALMMDECDSNGALSKALYAVAEPIWKDTPQNLRPIP